jgi:predicted nucleic acid-binding Zn ribbon protein
MKDDPREPARVGEGLEELLRRLGMPEEIDVTALVDEWSEVAGEPFGSMSRPASFGGGVLTIEVDDGAIASLLKYRLGDLVESLGRRFGEDRVTSVRIRVSRGKKGL